MQVERKAGNQSARFDVGVQRVVEQGSSCELGFIARSILVQQGKQSN